MRNASIDYYLKAFNCIRCLIPMIIIDIVIVFAIGTVCLNVLIGFFMLCTNQITQNEQLNAFCFSHPFLLAICNCMALKRLLLAQWYCWCSTLLYLALGIFHDITGAQRAYRISDQFQNVQLFYAIHKTLNIEYLMIIAKQLCQPKQLLIQCFILLIFILSLLYFLHFWLLNAKSMGRMNF